MVRTSISAYASDMGCDVMSVLLGSGRKMSAGGSGRKMSAGVSKHADQLFQMY